MDIDMSALRALEREKEISFALLVEAIEAALLIAYQRTEGHQPTARVELDRKSGHVTVWATETDEEGNAEERNQSMRLAHMLIAVGFMVFVGYPAFVNIKF